MDPPPQGGPIRFPQEGACTHAMKYLAVLLCAALLLALSGCGGGSSSISSSDDSSSSSSSSESSSIHISVPDSSESGSGSPEDVSYPYTIYNHPQDGMEAFTPAKIVYYSGYIPSEYTITDPADIQTLLDILDQIRVSDQPAAAADYPDGDNAILTSLSLYRHADDKTPVCCLHFSPLALDPDALGRPADGQRWEDAFTVYASNLQTDGLADALIEACIAIGQRQTEQPSDAPNPSSSSASEPSDPKDGDNPDTTDTDDENPNTDG